MSCGTCQNHLFCSACVDQLKEKKCPFCDQFKFQAVHKALNNILGKTKVKCSNNPCGNKEVTYNDLIKSHMNQCLLTKIECPMGCGQMLKGNDQKFDEAFNHFQKCPKVLSKSKQCKTCGFDHLPNHSG